MSGRIVQWSLLVVALVLLGVMAGEKSASQRASYSFYSTYDTGPNGYRALYELLGKYGVPTVRFEKAIGQLDPSIKTLVLTDNEADTIAGVTEQSVDKSDVKLLQRFVKNGGRLIVLTNDVPSVLADAFPVRKNRKRDAVFLSSPGRWSNAQIGKGDHAHAAFVALAGRPGVVAFDESLHGYVQAKSMWDALPQAVHIAVWIACLMVALWLVEANIRFVPATPVDPPDERDSSAYVRSMAQLLHRARGGAHVIARLYDEARRRAATGDELEYLSMLLTPSDAQVVRAARIAAELRKGYR